MHNVILGFGGNLPCYVGKPRETIKSACQYLASVGVTIQQQSLFYQSDAVVLDEGAYPAFTNCAATATTTLSVHQLLEVIPTVEKKFGRVKGGRWSARTLDIDVLFYDNMVAPNKRLWHTIAGSEDVAAILPEPVIPHPRIHKRPFVVAPLLDIAPEKQHPVYELTVKALSLMPEMQEQLRTVFHMD